MARPPAVWAAGRRAKPTSEAWVLSGSGTVDHPREVSWRETAANLGILFLEKGGAMISVQLTEEEAAILKSSLELLLSDVRMEICGTDSADFREGLKEQKSTLERVIAQLGEGVA